MTPATQTLCSNLRNRRSRLDRNARLTLAVAAFLGLGFSGTRAATKFWDTTAGTGNGVGGSGSWSAQSTNIFSTTSTGDASLTSAAATDDDIFQGTAGIITLGGSVAANTLTFNTTGYSITTSGSSTRVLTGPITLASGVTLTLDPISAAPLTVGSITGGTTGSVLDVGGSTAASTDAIRINLNGGSSIDSSAPINIVTTGTTGIAGFASNNGTATINASITNNSGVLTMIGATSGNTLNVNGAITGSAGLQFSAGSSGGAGTINLNAASSYQGATIFNAASTSSTIKLGVDNALPSGTDVTMGASASNGGVLDLNGHNLIIGSLASGAGGGSITNNAGGSGTSLLTIGGSTSPAAFGLVIKDGSTAKVALTRSGTGTTILSGSNTYTGATTINGGTLVISGSLGNTAVTINNVNSTLSSGANTTSAIAGAVTANNGTLITPGGVGTVGTFTLGGLMMNGGSTLNMDLLGSSNFDTISTSGVLTLGSGVETINIAGSGFSTGTYTLLSGYSSLSGGAFTLGATPAGFNYSLSTGATSTVLTVSALGGGGNLTWSLNGLAPSSSTDGAGTWSNGGGNFYNTGTAAATTWDNTAANNLTIGSGGTGGTITLGSNVRVGGTLTFAAVASPYTIGASGGTNTLTLAGGITANTSATINAPTILEASQTWSVTTGALTENGLVSGAAMSLTKTGVGTLVLTNASNSYSGGTVIGGGVLSVGADGDLGNASGGLAFGGGTLQTSAGITSARAVTLNSGGGTFDSNGFDSVLSGNITGPGRLTKIGTGALTLTGTNTYGGGTTVNAGTLNNNGSYSGATTLAGGTFSNGGSISLSGSSVAVTVTGNNATLTNLGSINQTGSGRAIRDNTGVTGLIVNNGSATNSTASIQNQNADVIQMNVASASVTLNNYGTMTSVNTSAGGSQVVDFNAITSGSNIVNNFSTGIMQASEADAVRPGVNGMVNNDGLIKATTSTGSGSDGVDAQTNTGITIVNAASAGSGTGTGTIEGARHGITGGNTDISVNSGAYAMSITNNLGGTIQGDNGSGVNIDGINGNELVTIVNHGTITGNGHDIGDGSAHDGDGVDVDGLVNITNTGTIKSLNSFGGTSIEFSEGVTVGGGTINNSGTIEGSVANGNTTAIGRGITIAGVDKDANDNPIPIQAPYGPANITNSGLIKGDSDSGIIFSSAVASGFSHTITNQVGGTIQTGSTTAPAILTGADNVTINNSGTIDGSSSGKAITLGSGNNTINILGGSAVILGNVTGGGGSNSLVVDPGSGNTFAYSGVITNFGSAQLKSGTFNLSGALGAPFTITGGTFAGTGTVNGFVTVDAGGVISPGSGIGKITLQSGVSLSTGGEYLWQLGTLTDDFTGVAGVDFDQIALTGGNLALGGSSELVLDFSAIGGNDPDSADPFWESDHSWTIVDGSGASNTGDTNFFQIADASFADGSFTTSTDANGNAVLSYQAVPEPASVPLVIAGLGLLGFIRRRKRSN